VGRRSRDDAVVVRGKSLRFHQRLPPPVRTTREIRVPQMSSVILLDDRFRVQRHFMKRAVSIVRDLLWMPQRPSRIRPSRGMTRIRPRRRVALVYRDRHRVVIDLAGKTSIPAPLKLSIPIANRQPDFDLDIRIGTGPRLD